MNKEELEERVKEIVFHISASKKTKLDYILFAFDKYEIAQISELKSEIERLKFIISNIQIAEDDGEILGIKRFSSNGDCYFVKSKTPFFVKEGEKYWHEIVNDEVVFFKQL